MLDTGQISVCPVCRSSWMEQLFRAGKEKSWPGWKRTVVRTGNNLHSSFSLLLSLFSCKKWFYLQSQTSLGSSWFIFLLLVALVPEALRDSSWEEQVEIHLAKCRRLFRVWVSRLVHHCLCKSATSCTPALCLTEENSLHPVLVVYGSIETGLSSCGTYL